MKSEWKEKPLEQCLNRFRVTSKIRRKMFADSGPFPIVSQEAEFINGFWDKAVDVCKLERPVVVFGDHTQVVKYIDFDFVVGADGVRVLNPKDFLEPKYLYYFVMAHRASSLGYARHYRHIKKQVVRYPSLEEQLRIVAILDETFEELDRARANAQTNLQNARKLFESYLSHQFLGGGPGKVTCTVGDLVALQRGFDITKKDQHDGKIPVVSSGGIKSYHNEAKAIGPGVIVGRKGSIGSVHFVESDYWPHDTTLWVKDFKGNDPRLIYYLLRSMNFGNLDTGAANPSLNRNLIHPLNVYWPDRIEQKNLVRQLDNFSNQSSMLSDSYSSKIYDLDALRQSILQKAFAGGLT